MKWFVMLPSGSPRGNQRIEAATWKVSEQGLLTLFGDDAKPIAGFSPGCWIGIVPETQEEALLKVS